MKKNIFENIEEAVKEPFCFDCDKEIIIENKEIQNGFLLEYETEDNEKYIIFKCDKCYDLNPELTEYKKCEIYARIVGYLRPITEANKGKAQEIKERKNYIIK